MWSLMRGSHSSGSMASKLTAEGGVHPRAVKHRLLAVEVDELLEREATSDEVGGLTKRSGMPEEPAEG